MIIISSSVWHTGRGEDQPPAGTLVVMPLMEGEHVFGLEYIWNHLYLTLLRTHHQDDSWVCFWFHFFFYSCMYVCVCVHFQHLHVFVWTKRMSADVSGNLNVIQIRARVYTQLIKCPSDGGTWLKPMCVNSIMCLFKTWSLTCVDSNSKPVCLSHGTAILNQRDLCQHSDNHPAKTSLSKSVVSQSNANTQL